MAQTTVELASLERLVASWDRLVRDFPQHRRQYLEGMGQELLERVRQEIGGSGQVAGWQQMHLGSGGGYVAIRPAADQYKLTQRGTPYAVGYVTDAIERGHQIRRPAVAGAKGYRPRATVAAVPGRWFYRTVRQQLDRLDPDEIHNLLLRIKEGLEGSAP